jgi:hypothetical protein
MDQQSKHRSALNTKSYSKVGKPHGQIGVKAVPTLIDLAVVKTTSLESFRITLNLGPCCKTTVTSAKSADWFQKSKAIILKVLSNLLPGPSKRSRAGSFVRF